MNEQVAELVKEILEEHFHRELYYDPPEPIVAQILALFPHYAELLAKLKLTQSDCPSCGGTGWVKGYAWRGLDEKRDLTKHREPCPPCQGSGKVYNLDRVVVLEDYREKYYGCAKGCEVLNKILLAYPEIKLQLYLETISPRVEED